MSRKKPPRKKPQQNRHPMKERVNIIIALIGLIGAIIAALIGIFPDLIGLSNDNKKSNTATPISFSRYDDPFDMFSIEYPSNFIVHRRETTDESVMMMFAENVSADEPLGENAIALGVFVDLQENVANDVSQYNDAVIDLFIKNEWQGITTDGNFKLISNEKRENGFVIHLEVNPFFDAYILDVRENMASIRLVYLFSKVGLDSYREVIERTYSTFSWSPSQIEQYFNQ